MTQALGPAAYVYEGFWMNWAKGGVQGLTLTLCPRSSNFLIAALTLFVAMSGGQLWTIVRFTLHQLRVSPRHHSFSALHNQQQLILRNITTDLASARLLICLAWAWRNSSAKPFTSSAIIVSIAILHAIFFMVAGTFSSNVATADQTVLSRSPYCGLFNDTYLETTNGNVNVTSSETLSLSVEFIAKVQRDVQLSVEYARECYNSSEAYYMSSSCNNFQQPRLNWTTLRNGTCPFDSKICYDNLETMVFDTGLIDSHNGLGINANFNDRVSYRRVTNCTILNDTENMSGWVNWNDRPDDAQIAYANYGSSNIYSTNHTYAYSNFANFFNNFSTATTTPYQVDAQSAYGAAPNLENPSGSTFNPIPELQQAHADLALFFLSYTGKYITPVDDPWFAAQQIHYDDATRAAIARKTYARNRPINTLACTEQHQLCTNGGDCTRLVGYDQLREAFNTKISLFTPNQNATVERLFSSVTLSSIKNIVNVLATSSTPLLAINSAASGSFTLSLGLPKDQWQAEVEFWHSVAMAHLQRIFVEYGTGQIAAQVKYLVPATTGTGKWICNNLMIRGTEFQSFNVLALSLMVGFGTLIVVCSLTVENLASYMQMRSGSEATRRKVWDDHDMLGLRLCRRGSQHHILSPDGWIDPTGPKIDLSSSSLNHVPPTRPPRTEIRPPGKSIRLCNIESPGMVWHHAGGAGHPGRWCRNSPASPLPPNPLPPNRTPLFNFGFSPCVEDQQRAEGSCAVCGARKAAAWHVGSPGGACWCDRCHRRYRVGAESPVAGVSGTGWV